MQDVFDLLNQKNCMTPININDWDLVSESSIKVTVAVGGSCVRDNKSELPTTTPTNVMTPQLNRLCKIL